MSNAADIYPRFFVNVLNPAVLTEVEAARTACVRLSRLHAYFERLADPRGQQQARRVAERAMDKALQAQQQDVAEVYVEWLNKH